MKKPSDKILTVLAKNPNTMAVNNGIKKLIA